MDSKQEKMVREAQKGDKNAFTVLLRENEQRMYRVARSFLSCEDDIADVMQESVLQAYLHLSDLKQVAYFQTWLVRIVINQCKDMLAKQRKVICVDQIMEQAGTAWKTGQKGRQGFWRRAGPVAAAVAAVCVIGFHSQIYSFAKSLFIHDTVTVGKKRVASEADMEIIKIKDGVLSNVGKEYYFESMEDLGKKLGISFLKSSEENDVTGEGRV